MADHRQGPTPTRVVPYANATDVDASRAFSADVLGFDVAMQEPVLGLASPANPSAQRHDRQRARPRRKPTPPSDDRGIKNVRSRCLSAAKPPSLPRGDRREPVGEDHHEALATTARFEQERERPWSLGPSLHHARQLLRDLVAFRVRATEIEGAFKLSQEQDQATRERVIAGLEAEPELARGDLPTYMRRFGGEP
jgi:hypothetical protein